MKRDSTEFQSSRGPMAGRVILLFAAYAPVAVVVGLRGLPSVVAWIAIGLGVLGVLVWTAFLLWLPRRQPRTSRARGFQYIDSEVTGYIVSILLPVVAASTPALNDWLAYGVCAALILIVAFAAELWSVNPITYAFGIRAGRAIVDGVPQVVLVRGQLGDDELVDVVRRAGVALVLGRSDGDRGDE